MKQGWEVKKLGGVCEIINGFAFKSQLFREEGENILRISNIQNGYVDLTDIAHFSKDDYPKTNFEKYAVLPNDIVVALSGATTGKFGINKTGKKLYLNQRVAICRESSSELNHLFLLYYLQTQSKSFLESAEGVAQPNLSTEQMKQYDIPVPPREEQERIVAELDCLSGVIERKREQLRELDALAQSIFYQMFGDPITNEKGWEIKKLGEVCDVRDGTHDSPKYLECSDYVLITSKNITNDGNIDFSTANYISKEDYESINKRSYVESGDIIMAMIGTIGKPIIVKETDKKFCIKNVALIKFGYSTMGINTYIQALLNNPDYGQYIQSQNKGGTQKFVALGTIRNLTIPLPPIEIQQQFANKINEIEKLKSQLKQSIKDAEELFNSRMNHYFN